MRAILASLAALTIITLLTASLATCSLPPCLTLRGEEHDIVDAREMLNTEGNILNCMLMSLEKGQLGQARSILDLYDKQYPQQLATMLER
jgi:hypothetical protein